MWNEIDKDLKIYKTKYKKEQSFLKDDIQNVLDNLNIEYKDLYNYANSTNILYFKRFIARYKENIPKDSYIAYMADKYYKMTFIRNNEIMLFMLMIVYSMFNYKMLDEQRKLFLKVCEISYDYAVKECEQLKDKPKILDTPNIILLSILAIPSNLGYTWQEYMTQMVISNANEMYKTIYTNYYNKDINMDKSPFIDVLEKQSNRDLSIHDGKSSGMVEDQVDRLVNDTKLEVGKQFNMEKCIFISEIDKRTTEMCKSLDGLVFNVNDWNEFKRYSHQAGGYIKYKIFGLLRGINLPPIDDHFHWCRSTISYNIELKNIELLAEYLQLKKHIPNEIPSKFEEYGNLRYNKDGFFEEIKDKEEVAKHFNKTYEIRKDNNRLNYISFKTYYIGYKKLRDELNKLDIDGIGNVKLSTHAFDRIIERKVDYREIIEVFNEKPTVNIKNDSINYKNDVLEVAISDKTHDIATVIKYKEGK